MVVVLVPVLVQVLAVVRVILLAQDPVMDLAAMRVSLLARELVAITHVRELPTDKNCNIR